MGDPFYLEVGESIVRNLQEKARVPCGFAAILDVRKDNSLEDKMDSFFLAETLKYLFLLFEEEKKLAFDLDKYVFSTEAHPLPLHVQNVDLSKQFAPWQRDRVLQDSAPPSSCPNKKKPDPRMSARDFIRHYIRPKSCALNENREKEHGGRASDEISGSARSLNESQQHIQFDGTPITPEQLDVSNPEHIRYLEFIGIMIEKTGNEIRLTQKAIEGQRGVEGLKFMQQLIALNRRNNEEPKLLPVNVRMILPKGGEFQFQGGPAAFGPDVNKAQLSFAGKVTVAQPVLGCSALLNAPLIKDSVCFVQRGGCMFIEKTRNCEKAGAIVVVVQDNQAAGETGLFTMSGDGNVSEEPSIPSVFVSKADGNTILDNAMRHGEELYLVAESSVDDGQE